jgi:S-adenosylmethionine decarboxylase
MPAQGLEWVIEAHGCDRATLADRGRLERLFGVLIGRLDLHPVGPGNWHQFPGAGGVTGLQLLRESHLACHSFPEFGSLCLNIFCCRPRDGADFEGMLKDQLGALRVVVRRIDRPYELETGVPAAGV